MKDEFRDVSDDELLSRTAELAARGRRIDAVLVAHLAEVETRRLHLREAFPSMFAYATERLRLSESQAYERITVARRSRDFPDLLEMLGDGRLTLTAAARIAPHLTEANAGDLLGRASHASKRDVQVLVAELAPQPDVPPSIRPLPVPASRTPAIELRPAGVRRDPPTVLVPIAPARFRVQFTAGTELEAKFTRAKALLRHQVPNGDLAEIVDRAMTLLLADLERKRCARTESPREQKAAKHSSRHIPAAVRRAVWQRDQGRCAFIDTEGRRCGSCEALELDHVVPFARGGDHTVENLRLLCQSHNGYKAELDYGRDVIERKREEARS